VRAARKAQTAPMWRAKCGSAAPPERPRKIVASASCCASAACSSIYKATRHGEPGSSSSYEPAMTTEKPERSSSFAWPRAIVQPSAKSQMPYVERPPFRPPIDRHGQIASHEHASKYGPATAQARSAVISCLLGVPSEEPLTASRPGVAETAPAAVRSRRGHDPALWGRCLLSGQAGGPAARPRLRDDRQRRLARSGDRRY